MKRSLLLFFLMSSYLTAEGQVNLREPFQACGINGSITIYDYQAKKWIASDINDSHYPTLPASTFKIVNTLIALEFGAIKDEYELVKWPGSTDTVKYGFRPEIYRDMSMREAFQLSAGWVYVELAKRIGKDKYRELLQQSHYGNVDLSIEDPDFWNFGDFAISPANQIEILIGVHEETLPFSKVHFATLKSMMIVEQTEAYILRAKTGWTRDGGKDTGWWVGYLEKEKEVYFFATRLIKDRADNKPQFGKCRKEITRTILRQLEILE